MMVASSGHRHYPPADSYPTHSRRCRNSCIVSFQDPSQIKGYDFLVPCYVSLISCWQRWTSSLSTRVFIRMSYHAFALSLIDVWRETSTLSSSALISPSMYDLRNPTITMPTWRLSRFNTSDYCRPWDTVVGQILPSSLLGDALYRL